MMEPDLAGFREAMAVLNEKFGALATFRIPPDPEDVEWPDDAGIDPETGMPFDPTVEAVGDSDAVGEVTARVEVVHRTTSQGAQTTLGALGWVEEASLALILLPATKEVVEGATEVVVFNERQRILSFRPDGIQPDVVDRWIVFCEGL